MMEEEEEEEEANPSDGVDQIVHEETS